MRLMFINKIYHNILLKCTKKILCSILNRGVNQTIRSNKQSLTFLAITFFVNEMPLLVPIPVFVKRQHEYGIQRQPGGTLYTFTRAIITGTQIVKMFLNDIFE